MFVLQYLKSAGKQIFRALLPIARGNDGVKIIRIIYLKGVENG
jgi:hypothetical protein